MNLFLLKGIFLFNLKHTEYAYPRVVDRNGRSGLNSCLQSVEIK